MEGVRRIIKEPERDIEYQTYREVHRRRKALHTRQKVNKMITAAKMIGVKRSQQVMKWGNL